MDASAPLPAVKNQTPTWAKAATLARAWELKTLSNRLQELDGRVLPAGERLSPLSVQIFDSWFPRTYSGRRAAVPQSGQPNRSKGCTGIRLGCRVHGGAEIGEVTMHILLRKLTGLHDISDQEQAALVATLTPPREIKRGADIVADGSTPKQTTVMLGGAACRYKILPGGKRHILTFQYPGDMTDLYSYVMKRLDHAVGALSDCMVAHISHDNVAALCEKYPNLQYAFWRDTMVDASISRGWALGESRKTLERVAHMICEIYVRLEVVGLSADDGERRHSRP
jgi:CRP-like cAMP-binding protein